MNTVPPISSSDIPAYGTFRISIVILVFIALIAGLLLWLIYTGNISRSVKSVASVNPDVDLIEEGIRNLYLADNNFRYFISTGDHARFVDYRINIVKIGTIIDSLQNISNQRNIIPGLKKNIARKTTLSEKYISSKKLSDSLLLLSVSFEQYSPVTPSVQQFSKEEFIRRQKAIISDSLTIEQSTGEKKSFLKKVQGLFKEEKETRISKTSVQRSTTTSDSLISLENENQQSVRLINDIHRFYQVQFEKLIANRNNLYNSEKDLITINNNLIASLDRLFSQARQSEIEFTSEAEKKILDDATRSGRIISYISIFVFITILIILFIVLNYLRKLNRYTVELQAARVKSEQLAIQKSNFLASMSHEIRAPLNTIIGLSEQLNKELLDEDLQKSVSGISRSSELLLETVNQILDYSRLESGKFSFSCHNFNPFNVIGEVIELMTVSLQKKKLTIRYDNQDKGQTLISGDEFRLKQIMINLVDNAIKYSEKGEIVIQARMVEENGKHRLKVKVSDQGIGIPKDQLQNIFIEFIRIEETGKRAWHTGTGLGLSICKRIIEQQDGTIEVTSREGEGSTFVFEIPYNSPLEEKLKPQIAPIKDKEMFPDLKILLAEDDEFSRLLVAKICSNHGIKVTIANSGEEAFDHLLKQDFHCVLTDLNMPAMDGFELVEKIRKIVDPKKSRIPVIATTANVMEKDLQLIIQSGMDGYLLKPYRESELVQAILAASKREH